MRALGQSPSDTDIRTMINHADLNSTYFQNKFQWIPRPLP